MWGVERWCCFFVRGAGGGGVGAEALSVESFCDESSCDAVAGAHRAVLTLCCVVTAADMLLWLARVALELLGLKEATGSLVSCSRHGCRSCATLLDQGTGSVVGGWVNGAWLPHPGVSARVVQECQVSEGTDVVVMISITCD